MNRNSLESATISTIEMYHKRCVISMCRLKNKTTETKLDLCNQSTNKIVQIEREDCLFGENLEETIRKLKQGEMFAMQYQKRVMTRKFIVNENFQEDHELWQKGYTGYLYAVAGEEIEEVPHGNSNENFIDAQIGNRRGYIPKVILKTQFIVNEDFQEDHELWHLGYAGYLYAVAGEKIEEVPSGSSDENFIDAQIGNRRGYIPKIILKTHF